MTQPMHPDEAAGGLQAQRDAVELHEALALAIKRLTRARGILADLVYDPAGFPGLEVRDLMVVLARTSRVKA